MVKLSKFIISTKKEFEEAIFTQSLSDREFITPAKKLKKYIYSYIYFINIKESHLQGINEHSISLLLTLKKVKKVEAGLNLITPFQLPRKPNGIISDKTELSFYFIFNFATDITLGRYTYDVHEYCLIFKTPHPLVHLRPKIFPPI